MSGTQPSIPTRC
ncbi:hypothetical protein MAR_002472 [Mya arenaria]|uniref:Uncharacterized protein n=1 Tax=Mya arenaria TaxID=6604 RepID=A0ABY7FHJ3_MYAAR|nr:hypothetical protein MAR_002472 [Mya arenaria]